MGFKCPLVPKWGGIRFRHHSCIVMNGSVIIGKNCTLHQGVTLGKSFAGEKAGDPILSDNVVVFAGAKIIGNVHIGSHVVGANAVVINDVPDFCVVAGVPAKIISHDSTKCFEGIWKNVHCF